MNSRQVSLIVSALVVLAGCGVGMEAPNEETTFERTGELQLERGRFEVFEGRDGQFYFHLLAGNGQKVLASEGYKTWDSAEEGIAAVQQAGSEISRYDLRPSVEGQWYFVISAANHEIVGVSETYTTRSGAREGMNTVARVVAATVEQGAAVPEPSRFRIFRGLDGRFYFHLRADNGEIVLQSEGYETRTSAADGISAVRENGANPLRYQLHSTVDGRYFFVLRAANNRIIARGQSYASEGNANSGVAVTLRLLGAQS